MLSFFYAILPIAIRSQADLGRSGALSPAFVGVVGSGLAGLRTRSRARAARLFLRFCLRPFRPGRLAANRIDARRYPPDRMTDGHRGRDGGPGSLVRATLFKLQQAPTQWDVIAIVISLGAVFALLRLKIGTIKLIFACAIMGLVVSYFR